MGEGRGGVVGTDTCFHLSHVGFNPSISLTLVLLPRCCRRLVATSPTPTLGKRTFSHLLWVGTVKETPDQEGLVVTLQKKLGETFFFFEHLFRSARDTMPHAFPGCTYVGTEAACRGRERMPGLVTDPGQTGLLVW